MSTLPTFPNEGTEARGETRAATSLSGRVLVVDDDPQVCELIEEDLAGHDLEVEWRTNPRDALELAATSDFDVIVTDLSMEGIGGLELCERILAMSPDVPVIVITGHASLESAIAAIRAGAHDYIVKPIDPKTLVLTISRALQLHRLKDEVKRLRRVMRDEQRFEEIVGSSAAMTRMFDLIGRIADTETSVLITGESGTGKELVAHALHSRSARKNGPFLAINCAAVPATLLESELFGHVRGAFTDAKGSRTGLFVQANGGTLFLDEIGELPLEVQPKLLRALQERKVRPVGSNDEIPFDARVIAATNSELETEVAEKRFREDLYYRINVVRLDVPPLRERGSDVLLLAQHFVERFAERSGKHVTGLLAEAAEKVLAYDWPGNVRELENSMERAVALTRFDRITVEDLPEKIRACQADRLAFEASESSELVSLDDLERRYVLRVLSVVGGNKSRAAQILKVDRRTLYRKLDRYGKPA